MAENDVIIFPDPERTTQLVDLFIVADTQGRALQPKKMYKTTEIEIKILDMGKKTVDGAVEFINNANVMGK